MAYNIYNSGIKKSDAKHYRFSYWIKESDID